MGLKAGEIIRMRNTFFLTWPAAGQQYRYQRAVWSGPKCYETTLRETARDKSIVVESSACAGLIDSYGVIIRPEIYSLPPPAYCTTWSLGGHRGRARRGQIRQWRNCCAQRQHGGRRAV